MPIVIWWDIRASERPKMTVAGTNAELGLIGARPIAARQTVAEQNSPWRLSVESGTIVARHIDAAAPIGAPARPGRHRLVRVVVCSIQREPTDSGRQSVKGFFFSSISAFETNTHRA